MLVLRRKAGGQIRIGEDIIITVVETHTGSVKLGIDAPKDVKVNREEIYQDILLHGKNFS